MKKILLTTTAMVATASIATAQDNPNVRLSGTAEMGFFKASNADAKFHSDLDVKFSLTGGSDSGFDFGASIDLDEISEGINAQNSPAAVFITSSTFGTLSLGDIDGAFDKALDDAGSLTSIADDHTEHAGYSGNSGLDGLRKSGGSDQILRYDYAFNDFELSLSYELGSSAKAAVSEVRGPAKLTGATVGERIVLTPAVEAVMGFDANDDGDYNDEGDTAPVAAVEAVTIIPTDEDVNGPITTAGSAAVSRQDGVVGVGVSYYGDLGGFQLGVGLGYQVSDDDMAYGASLKGGISGFDIILNYSKIEGPNCKDDTHYAVGLSYTFDDLSVHANYGAFEKDIGCGNARTNSKPNGFGIAINYALGGGAVIQAGYGHSDNVAADKAEDTYSLGLSLSF